MPAEAPKKAEAKSGPWVPPEGEYEIVPPDPLHDLAAKVLGIKEYPAKPAADLPPPGGRFQRIYQIYQQFPKLFSNLRTMKELKCRDGSTWRPPRMMLRKQWQAEDADPKWFEHIYSHLYHRVSEFASDHLGYGDLPTDSRSSIWLAGFSDNFKWYTSAVARQDNNAGGWDALLISRERREFLVSGIIAKVLHKHVWEGLLFGATEAQKEMLEAQDKLTVGLDGYQRTASRSDQIRSLLGGSTVTPYFWRDVDRLTLQLVNLFLPLIRILDAKFKESKSKSLRKIYQDMHNIVTEAAFLSIGIRWSPDIFRFIWPIPGQPFDGNHEHSISEDLYETSKTEARKLDEAAQRNQDEKALLLQQEQEALATVSTARVVSFAYKAGLDIAGGIMNAIVRLGMDGQDPVSLQAQRDKFRDGPSSHTSRLAKVHIATWPCLVRHTIVGKLGSHPVLGHLDAEGETITVLMNAPVVYYYGLDDAPGEFLERIPTLNQWIYGKRLERFWKVGFPLLLVSLVLSVAGWYSPLVGRLVGYAGSLVWRIVGMVARLLFELLFNIVGFVFGLFKALLFFGYAVVNSFARPFGYERPMGGPSWVVSQNGPWGGSADTEYDHGYPRLNSETFKILWSLIFRWVSWRPYDSITWEWLKETASGW